MSTAITPLRCDTPKASSPKPRRRCSKDSTRTRSTSAATYDGEDEEPVVLPAAFPNLLANGSSGIAVGMATSIPPHNLGELCAALTAMIENPNIQDRTLFKLVKGPDFPTGGILMDDAATIAESYRTGRGSFRLRALWNREDGARGMYQLIVTEIPYQVQKAKLIAQIAELLEQKKLPLLDDVHDESAEDVRIVLTPKSRTVEPELLMEQLFRQSDLETRFPLNMNVLDKGLVPRVMSLRDVLAAFIAHRREVLERRSRHRLEKIAARLEVLEGYLAVYLNLDKVIRIIRTEDEPRPKLMKAFSLTENQADAILNMRLRSLRKLEEMEIHREHAALAGEQKDLKKLLGSPNLQSERLIAQVAEIDARFGLKTVLGKRRTRIAEAKLLAQVEAISEEVATLETAAEKPITVVCSEKGWLRAFKGHQEPSDAVKYREGDRERFWVHAETTDKLMMFATDGRFFTLDCARLPGRARQRRGDPHLHRPAARGRSGPYVRAQAGQEGFARLDLRPRLHHQRGRGGRDDQGGQAGDEREDRRRSRRVPLRRRRLIAVVGENRKMIVFALEELPRDGARAGELSAALQGRRAAGRHDLHLEGRLEGREQPRLVAVRAQGMARAARAGGTAGAARLGQVGQIRVVTVALRPSARGRSSRRAPPPARRWRRRAHRRPSDSRGRARRAGPPISRTAECAGRHSRRRRPTLRDRRSTACRPL